MATCPMCNTPTEESTCPVCGSAVPATTAAPVTPVAEVDDHTTTSDWGQGASRLDATAVGWTAERAAPPLEPDATRLSAGVPDDPAPWDDPASLYRSGPVTPPPWGGQAMPGQASYAPTGYDQHGQAGYGAGQPVAPGYPPQGYAPAPGDPRLLQPTYAAAPAKSKAPLIAGAVVALAAVTVGAVLLVPRVLGGAAAPTATAGRTTPAAAPATPSLSAAPVSVPAPAPAPATTQTQQQPAGGASGYFTVLDSLNKKWFTPNQARVFADNMAAKGGRTLVVVDSDATGGMNPGYFVVGEGLSPDASAGERICPAWGRKAGEQGSDCYSKPVAYSSSSVVAGPGTPDTPAQECQRVAPQQRDACTSAYDFLTRYARIESAKSMSAAEIGNWWTDPGYYYSDTATPLTQLREKLVKPTASNMEYLSGNLYSYQSVAGGGAVVQVIVPYRENRVLHIAEVTYVLVPGSGTNPFRLFKVTDEQLA